MATSDQEPTNQAPFPRIPAEHAELWRQLSGLRFDKPDAPYPFSKRLAKRNKWDDHKYALRVIDEYRKFVFLTQVTGHMCTPSINVDEAWHLHLIYTVHYRMMEDKILGKPLHHHPGDGSDEDAEKFAAIYERTLDDYQKYFGTPPHDIWGHPNPTINWRAILAALPVGKGVKDALSYLVPPAPSEEAP